MLGDLEGNPEPIEVKLFGGDEAELRRQALRVAAVDRRSARLRRSVQRAGRLLARAARRDRSAGGGARRPDRPTRSRRSCAPICSASTPRRCPSAIGWCRCACAGAIARASTPRALDRVRLRTPAGRAGAARRRRPHRRRLQLVGGDAREPAADGAGDRAPRRRRSRQRACARSRRASASWRCRTSIAVEIGGQRLSQRRAFFALAEALARGDRARAARAGLPVRPLLGAAGHPGGDADRARRRRGGAGRDRHGAQRLVAARRHPARRAGRQERHPALASRRAAARGAAPRSRTRSPTPARCACARSS